MTTITKMSLPVECKWKDLNRNPFGLEGVVVFDPPGDGNCLFRSISEQLILAGIDYSTKDLRALAAENLENWDQASFDSAMVTYRIDKKEAVEEAERTNQSLPSMFVNWNPDTTTTTDQLAKAIMRPVYSNNGFDFQGDNIILAFLRKGLDIDFIVFDTNNPNSATRICGDKKSPFTAFLILRKSRSGANHYQALGISFDSDDGQNTHFQAIFPSNNLPKQFADHLMRIDKADEDRKRVHEEKDKANKVVEVRRMEMESKVKAQTEAELNRQQRQQQQQQNLLLEQLEEKQRQQEHECELQRRRLQQEHAQREIQRQQAMQASRTYQASQVYQASQTYHTNQANQAIQLRQMQLERARAQELEQRRIAQIAQYPQSGYFSVNEFGSAIGSTSTGGNSGLTNSALSYLQQTGLNNYYK